MTPGQRSRIGVFDSGIGGLTVVAELLRVDPGLDIVYLGDTARLPYGTKSRSTVRRYTQRNVELLERQGVDGVVIACNSATALAFDELETSVPVWGVIDPGARAACAVTGGNVAVFATEATVRSGAYTRALRGLSDELGIQELEVQEVACPLLVPLVEEGWEDHDVTRQVVRHYWDQLDGSVDTLILGCTHYPLLRSVLEDVAGPRVRIVDSARSTAETVVAGLGGATGHEERAARVMVTDTGSRFALIAERILGYPVPLEHVDVTAGEALESTHD